MSIKSHLPYQEPGESQLEWEKRQQTPKLRWHRLLELSDDDLKAAIIKNVWTKKKMFEILITNTHEEKGETILANK